MSRSGLNPDNYTYNALWCASESGRLEEAEKMFYSMQENGCSPDSYANNFNMVSDEKESLRSYSSMGIENKSHNSKRRMKEVVCEKEVPT
ncbi:hypothetical protein JHK86_022655 [Glycine max]|nr:hypothetical protein JHK86_022655 [Glycine max]